MSDWFWKSTEYGAPILKFQKDLPDFPPSHWVMSYADGEYRIPNPSTVKFPIPNPAQLMSYADGEYRISNPAQVMSYADGEYTAFDTMASSQ